MGRLGGGWRRVHKNSADALPGSFPRTPAPARSPPAAPPQQASRPQGLCTAPPRPQPFPRRSLLQVPLGVTSSAAPPALPSSPAPAHGLGKSGVRSPHVCPQAGAPCGAEARGARHSPPRGHAPCTGAQPWSPALEPSPRSRAPRTPAPPRPRRRARDHVTAGGARPVTTRARGHVTRPPPLRLPGLSLPAPYLPAATSFWRKVSTRVSRSFTLGMAAPGGTAGHDPSGPFSSQPPSAWTRRAAAMLNPTAKSNGLPRPAPRGPPLAGPAPGASGWKRRVSVTEPRGRGGALGRAGGQRAGRRPGAHKKV